MTGLVRRLAHLSPRELRFRLGEAACTAVEAARYSCGGLQADRRTLALSESTELVRCAGGALSRGDLAAANAALRLHYLERPASFVITPHRRLELASAVLRRFPDARKHATSRAEGFLQGRYDLLGYQGLSFRSERGDIDWRFDPVHQSRAPVRFWVRVPYLDPRYGDHKIIWELNRHQHWLALGRAA